MDYNVAFCLRERSLAESLNFKVIFDIDLVCVHARKRDRGRERERERNSVFKQTIDQNFQNIWKEVNP